MANHPIIELDALLRDYLLGLVLIAGTGQDVAARPVQWVHSSDLDDPTPFLTPRTVLLTTGTQFARTERADHAPPSPDDVDDQEVISQDEAISYVQRLIDAGVTALGVAVGVRWERIPPPVIEACDRLHLPLFRVPYDTPFIAVVRTAARLLEAESHAIESRASGWGREHSQQWGVAGRRGQLIEAEAALRSAVLQLLLAGHRKLAEQVAASMLPPLPRGSIVIVRFDTPLAQTIASEINAVVVNQPGVLAATDSGITTVVLESGTLAALRRTLVRHEVAAGVSERGASQDISELAQQAERAHELALRRERPAPLAYQPAMHAGVLHVLSDSPEAIRRAASLLAPMREHDRRHGDAIERSLKVWLSHHGQTSPAAAELGVHRHTLRNRVQTASSLLQRDLEDPDTRAELWAALRLVPATS